MVTQSVRTCMGCRERAAKVELLRLVAVRPPDAKGWQLVPDPKRVAPGRGAHLHPTIECFDQAKRRRAFARALRLDAVDVGPVEQYLNQE